MKWFKDYVERVKPFHRASITASLHTEHLNSKEKMQDFADKLIFCQEHDVQITINMVMVPDWFEKDWDNALFFHNQGINVTLKPQSDPTASRVVDGYTDEMLQRLHNGMPQMGYTETKRQWADRPKPNFELPTTAIGDNDKTVPWHFQVEFEDSTGKKWYMDQAERFNAFNFNKFKGWSCNAGYQGIIIREPDGSIKRSYSCYDNPLGNIETGFKLFDSAMPCISPSCVSSADSKIPKRKV
tara:strand:- start:175 stop:897 length:723 start_codon:yes stop_codon:yes gene_type:complete